MNEMLLIWQQFQAQHDALITFYWLRDSGWLCSVLRPRQHSIGYVWDGFYMSKDPTNTIKVLKENLQRKIRQHKEQNTHMHSAYTIIDKQGYKYTAQVP